MFRSCWFDCIIVSVVMGAVAGCGGDDAPDSRVSRTLQMYEANLVDQCLEPPVEAAEPCLFETSEVSSGVGTDACLVGPDGEVFIIEHYGYTEELGSEGWSAFWLEIADSEREHDAEPGPAGCEMARGLLDAAYAECEMNHMSDTDVCDDGSGFGPALADYLPICRQ